MYRKSAKTVAFYNTENFFDTRDDPYTQDDFYTPKGVLHWTFRRYLNKTRKIARVISRIGQKENASPPVIVGLAEIENKKVLHDIVKRPGLSRYGYRYVHFDSPDKRGIDTALLYRPSQVEILHARPVPVQITGPNGEFQPTRDFLHAKIRMAGQTFHIIVVHWPSRREGFQNSHPKRMQAARQLVELIEQIRYENPHARIIIMGDFNASPQYESVQQLTKAGFINLAATLQTRRHGTIVHRRKWHLFDQIIVSPNLKNRISPQKIYKPFWLKVYHGIEKGFPFRTYKGKRYQGGYSDHFPVYTLLYF